MGHQMPFNSLHAWDEVTQIVTTSHQDFFSLEYSHASKLIPSEASFKELSTLQKFEFFDLKKGFECL